MPISLADALSGELSPKRKGARLLYMKCHYCQEAAGWFSRTCQDCRRLLDLYHTHRGQLGLLQFLELFTETGVPHEKIEAFLNADPRGEGTIKDHIIADMSTELLNAMGVNVSQSPQDVKRLREKGTWRGMDERSKEES